MGRRGPRPLPTALKRTRGARRDRINEAEPVPAPGPVTCPTWLSPEAREVWNRLAPDLSERGVLTAWDVDLFAFFCDLVAQAKGARELLTGFVVTGRRDRFVSNPVWRSYRDAIAEVRSLAREFGLTPSARSTLHRVDLPDLHRRGGKRQRGD